MTTSTTPRITQITAFYNADTGEVWEEGYYGKEPYAELLGTLPNDDYSHPAAAQFLIRCGLLLHSDPEWHQSTTDNKVYYRAVTVTEKS